MAGSHYKRQQNLTGTQAVETRREVCKDDPRVMLLAVHAEGGLYWKIKDDKIATGVLTLRGAAGAEVGEGGVHGHLSL